MSALPALAPAQRAAEALRAGQQRLAAQWAVRHMPRELLRARCALVDAVICALWQELALPATLALVAVGGYGRGELFPFSDIDLLILVPDDTADDNPDVAHDAALSAFIQALWDSGLDIGHSVRTVTQCQEAAASDITVETALLEARYLSGALDLFETLRTRYRQSLDVARFIKAKMLEQAERHARYLDTPYALEPNCKESPGGLRDLQVILWAARAAQVGDDWPALAEAGLLRATEARQLAQSELRLQRLRIELHLLTGRGEERLLFDFQEGLARRIGLPATPTRRASESLMQLYYRNARRVTLLNAMVLPALAQHGTPGGQGTPILIDEQFQSQRDLLDIRDAQLFEHTPQAILRCFLLQMQRGELHGMTPRTLRALWHARHRIDERFRAEPQNRALFLSLFQQRHLIRPLRRMAQYGILGRYLPAFGQIEGQMQHDLFHAYTVDQHILQVMRNLRRFAMPEFAHEYPFCSRLMAGFERPWLLYLAALFHDIAKGRGGDHSQRGMVDAQQFCNDHALGDEDSALIVFLVQNHLVMSSVAQKQDLADPDVVRRFAALAGSHRRLVALYLLTVADIRGTSPKVWNSWKAKLLEDLFRMCSGVLRGDESTTPGGVGERQEEARRLLRHRGLRPGVETALWEQLDTAYFMRHDADEIAWHARMLYYRVAPATAVVTARVMAPVSGLQVMVYVADQAQLFARLCYVFARMGFGIADAKIHTTRHGYALDSFFVVSTAVEDYRDSAALLEHELSQRLGALDTLPEPPTARLSRQVRHFPIVPEIEILRDERGGHYILNLIAADRPGLLYAVARILSAHDIRLHTAKVATLGERVEDVFLISGKKLDNAAALVRLEQDLLAALAI